MHTPNGPSTSNGNAFSRFIAGPIRSILVSITILACLSFAIGAHFVAAGPVQVAYGAGQFSVARLSRFFPFFAPLFSSQISTNKIAAENALAGNPASEWDITGDGDESIQGFASAMSVNVGQTIDIKVRTDAPGYHVDIYRMGYYGGAGARKVASVVPTTSLPQLQPECISDEETGLIDCGNWAVSVSWMVPLEATSGIYFAKLIREDTNGASHVFFVVRDDDSHSELLYQTSDTTWQAYNQYGGNSLYTGLPAGRAYKVSYNRPFTTRRTSGEDWVFNSEYPMVRWLERNGYDVSYFSGVDSDRLGAEILEHKAFLSVGHDEYWSGSQRANVRAARDAGVNLAFFSGNEIFWKTRWEASIDGSGTQHRTLVCYKETHANSKIDPLQNTWTGTWRDNRGFNPEGPQPENALTGTAFMVNSGTAPMKVPAADGKMRFWRNTDIATLTGGNVATLADSSVGYEWDEDLDNGSRPAGLFRLSTTTVNNVDRLQDNGSTYGTGNATHHLTLYRRDNPGTTPDALVFGSGTVQWSWGLDNEHDRGNAPVDQRMQQATVNLFADMGVQPGTLQSDLTAATATADAIAPTSAITSPANGTTLPSGSPVTITGTAQDAVGAVGGVEVSVDGGATWHPANGRQNWSYTWTPQAAGNATIQTRAVDDSGNLESSVQSVTVTVEAPSTGSCPCSIWDNSETPVSASANDSGAVEIGVKFRSNINGVVTGIRFYKGSQNTGTHTGHLWSAAGALIASVSFDNETGSGWQAASLSSPVALTANTTYIVSYHAPVGMYSADPNYFGSSAHVKGPLTALQNGDDGLNGLYKYGPSGSFPTDSFNATNYWVDVVFAVEGGSDTAPPTVIASTPGPGATAVSTSGNISGTFNEPIDTSSINSTSFELRDSGNNVVASIVAYDPATRSATLDPTANLASSTAYTATLKGGQNDPRVKDTSGNAMEANYSWTFTTAASSPPPPDLGPGGPILVVSADSNPFSRYYAEILHAEGLNAFTVKDISNVSASTLSAYQVVIVGDIPLTSAQATMFSDWVTAGGNLIATRPDADLAQLLGVNSTGQTVSNGYILADTSTPAGSGIVNQTIQFHGTADKYTLNGATAIADLYSNATTATTNPAVTLRSVGTNGGQAAAFTYDLARSVVYTRQGNPAWAGDERDGQDGPIRSDDLFYGAKAGDEQADWVDLNKVSIPQADEQQRLLANLITQMNLDKIPLPRLWYFPKGLSAVVVLTGDDHANGGTPGQFDGFKAASAQGCSVDDWECIRSTSYIFPDTPLTDAQAATYQDDGFEIGVHINTGCANFTPSSLESNFVDQIREWSAKYSSLSSPVTNRTHCIAWSDWVTHPKVELAHGVRLDTNYYYWPGAWVNDRPGMFTGSGIPMRFADIDGTTIDVYQAATQITDESGQNIPNHIDALLSKATGPEGFYGAFTANMHTDSSDHAGANAIVASAVSKGVSVVSAKQMLTWLDGRNGSSFGSLAWNNNALSFTINVGAGARNMQAMIPIKGPAGILNTIKLASNQVMFTTRTIKGVEYAFFPANEGSYTATYVDDVSAPTVASVSPGNGATSVAVSSDVNATFSEGVDVATINAATFELRDAANNLIPAAISYDSGTNTAILNPTNDLSPAAKYTAKVKGGSAGVKDQAGNALAADFAWNFTIATMPDQGACPCSIWSDSTTPSGNSAVTDNQAIEVGVKFRSNVDGFVSGVRFYKGAANVGTHTGHLWTAGGQMLAETVFANETASGWQTILFSNPVAVTANTTYVASYFSADGYFAIDTNFFTNAGVARGPLTALQSGTDGPNGVYRYGGGFPDGGNTANYWVDIVFENVAGDTSAPAVTGHTPADVETGVAVDANVTAQFNEPMDGSTLNAQTFRLRADGAQSDVTATVISANAAATLDPSGELSPNTLYHVTVAGTVKDANGNTMGSDVTWSFTTAAAFFGDTTVEDFGAGTIDSGTIITKTADGEILLKPTISEEFAGSELPTGWTVTPWSSSGSGSVSNSELHVDGALATFDAFTGSGHSLEFSGTFGVSPFQHAGFGVDVDNTAVWAMFSTNNATDGLYARTNNNGVTSNVLIQGSWLGTAHRYRIDWNPTNVVFYIDGVAVHTETVSITTEMRPLVSDFQPGGPDVSIDWIRMSPYAAAGTFTSRVFDAGAYADWQQLANVSQVPAGAAVTFETRTGAAFVPDALWSGWQPVNGTTIASPNARYLQYRVVFATTSDQVTPVVEQVTLSYLEAVNQAPVAGDDAYQVNEDDSLNVATVNGVLMNDTDDDGNPLAAVKLTDPAHGVLSLNSDGSFIYTPTANFNGPDSFTYRANDGVGDSNSATVSITVIAEPLPSPTPTATPTPSPTVTPTPTPIPDPTGTPTPSPSPSASPSASPTPTATPTATPTPDPSPEPASISAPFDYDGDAKSDFSVWRPADGTWYLALSNSGTMAVQPLGLTGDKIVPADFDGDGMTDMSVYRPDGDGSGVGRWYVINSSNSSFNTFQFGVNGDVPLPQDYDGDGRADLCVFRPADSTWYMVKSSNNLFYVYPFGIAGDKPVPADYSGDGKAEIAVWRPADGSWHTVDLTNGAYSTFNWGVTGDVPVPGDYSGDGRADYSVYRPANNTWYRMNSSNFFMYESRWGIANDIPTPGDYDGDGSLDLAVFRPVEGRWYVLTASFAFMTQQFGINGDKPTESAFVY